MHLLRYFTYDHLPAELQAVSKPYADMAHWLAHELPHGAEATAALRKLLESKDCAVRAVAIDG